MWSSFLITIKGLFKYPRWYHSLSRYNTRHHRYFYNAAKVCLPRTFRRRGEQGERIKKRKKKKTTTVGRNWCAWNDPLATTVTGPHVTTPRLEGLTPPTVGHGNLCRDNRTHGSPPTRAIAHSYIHTHNGYKYVCVCCADMIQIEKKQSEIKENDRGDESEKGKNSVRNDVVASICILNAEFRLNLRGDWSKWKDIAVLI